MYFDLPLEQLKTYLPHRPEPKDFDLFWQQTLQESNAYPLEAQFTHVDCGMKLVEVFDVTFNGYHGQPIKGWFIIPKESKTALPCVVEYIGYGGGRGLPLDWLTWANAGCAHFVMDTRGQGSTWRAGDTADIEVEPGNPHIPGFMTRGILQPSAYYYRRVYVDAVRAVQAARSYTLVDAGRMAVTGGSQGGGISLAVSGLVPDLSLVMPDVPFLCHIRHAVEMIDTDPYNEIARYCKTHRMEIETVFNTLSYFDGMNFAARSNAEALFSVGLMDTICPPSTVFAAYNHYAGKKDICIWQFNNHEGGENYQTLEKIKFAQRKFFA